MFQIRVVYSFIPIHNKSILYTQNKIPQVTIVLFLNPIVVVWLQTILFERCNSPHLLLKYRDDWHSESSQLDKSQILNVVAIFLNNDPTGIIHPFKNIG